MNASSSNLSSGAMSICVVASIINIFADVVVRLPGAGKAKKPGINFTARRNPVHEAAPAHEKPVRNAEQSIAAGMQLINQSAPEKHE